VFLSLSCKKKEPSPAEPVPQSPGPNGVPIHQDVAKMKFRLNSYWVYVDSLSAQTDSSFVDSIRFDGYFHFPGVHPSPDPYEVYIYFLRSSFSGNSQPYVLVASTQQRNSMAMMGPGNGTTTYASYTYATGYPVNNSSAGDTISVRDSLFVFDRFYNKIVISQRQNDPDEGNLKTIYYSNSDFGLLRKDVFNTNGTLKHKWLLKNKNVIR
jgi:hypothetical protein